MPFRHVVLSHAKDQKISNQNRRYELERDEALRHLQQDKIIQANMESEDLIEERRNLRNAQRILMEQEKEESIRNAEIQKVLKEQQKEQEERLAKELQAIKLEKLRNEKLKQKYRVNSLELRELEAKLRAGYMNKERAAQLAEKQALQISLAQRESETAKEMLEDYERAIKHDQIKERERWEKSVQYQEQLESQLQEQEQTKQKQYEEFLKEKHMIDEIVRKIYEEDQREMEARLLKQKENRELIEDFIKKREQWKLQERLNVAEENERIMRFVKEIQHREKERTLERKKKEQAIIEVQKLLSEKLAAELHEKEETERIRTELYFEEQEEIDRQKEMLLVEKRIRDRLELQETIKEQLNLRERKKAAEKEEEEEFRQKMLQKFSEDDRIDQMNAQKRRLKQQEHKRAVEKLIEERRIYQQKDKQRALEEQKEIELIESHRMQIIEEERQRLLQEHASKLVGFLPKGVLRDANDLQLFDERFQQMYSKRKSDSFDETLS
ncbi:meiosis-specific nuclear structural protein 1 isoform X3 [Hydra vulgaris]|uniref:Meiosis-specific nuclear structural protein 1 n=1 Tax=Hydra vulgaris TaxID=6087 RepID=A0ABM4CIH8_HYDVU